MWKSQRVMINYNELPMGVLVRHSQKSSKRIVGVLELERNIYNYNHPITRQVKLR